MKISPSFGVEKWKHKRIEGQKVYEYDLVTKKDDLTQLAAFPSKIRKNQPKFKFFQP